MVREGERGGREEREGGRERGLHASLEFTMSQLLNTSPPPKSMIINNPPPTPSLTSLHTCTHNYVITRYGKDWWVKTSIQLP